jgi:hypothetical protein
MSVNTFSPHASNMRTIDRSRTSAVSSATWDWSHMAELGRRRTYTRAREPVIQCSIVQSSSMEISWLMIPLEPHRMRYLAAWRVDTISRTSAV